MSDEPALPLGGEAPAQGGEAPARRKWFDWRIIPVLVITMLVMVVLVDRLAGTDEFVAALQNARWSLLSVAFGLLAVCQLTAALRWKLILGALGRNVPLVRVIGAMLASWPFALLTPARASDLLRALPLADLVPPFEGAGSVVAEKAIDLQSMCLLTMVGATIYGLPLIGLLAFAMMVAEWIVIALILRKRDFIARLPLIRRKPERIEQLLLAFTALVRHPVRLLVVTATSVASWLLAMGLLQCLFAMTGAEVGLAPTLALWPAAVLAGTLPLTLAGMGTRDAAFAFLLRAVGWTPIREGALLAATFGYALIGTWVLAIVGIPFAIRFVLRLGRKRRAEASEVT